MSKLISKIVVPDSSEATGYALYNVKDANAIPASEKGVASGVATLDSSGKVPSSQLPSYVDDVIEGYYHDNKFYATYTPGEEEQEGTYSDEITPELGKIYVDIPTNQSYRWSGSTYIVISSPYVLPTASANTLGGVKVGDGLSIDNNGVLSAEGQEVEIGTDAPVNDVKLFVDEDTDPAVSLDVYTRAQTDTMLGNKVDKITGKGLSTNDFDDTAKDKLDDLPSASEAAVSGGTDLSLVTTGEKYNWNNMLPLSGGTMTGVITLKPQCVDDGYNSGALHCNNSNIDGINGIYFADNSDSVEEGINFYHDPTHVDSIYAAGGILRFVPNRQLGYAGNSYTVYHSGNFNPSNYLPLSGGTMTGTLNMTYDTVQMNFRTGNDRYNSKMEYMTHGSEAMVWANQNPATSFIFKCGLDLTDTSNWSVITPSLQIKNQSVYINALVGNDITPSYNFYVNGSSYFAGDSIVSGSLTANGGIELENTNEINGTAAGAYRLHLNYNTSGLVSICYGGGNCGVGTTEPSYKLHVAGAVGATGFTNTSDIRKKDIIENLNIDVEDIANAPVFKFTWLDPEMPEGVNVGTSALYWQTILPEIVTAADDDEKTLSMQYGVAGLVSSVALAKKVVEQEETIKAQEARIKALEDAIADIQNKLNN